MILCNFFHKEILFINLLFSTKHKINWSFYVFSEFMKSSSIKDPPELRRKCELFTVEQRALNKKRMDLLESLRFVYTYR